MSNYFITTSIPYVNGEPHLGHAMEFVMADVLARYSRQQGTPTIFSIGTDEHGGKNAEKAAEMGITPQQFVDQNSAKFAELATSLNISHDRFIRTTDKSHEDRSKIIWKNLSEYIYKGKYIGLYCTGCEEYKTEAYAKETNGICPDHNRAYEKLEEDNYFLKLSSFNDQIKHAIESGSFRVVPKSRKNEILSVLNEGLEDISISRPKEKIDWGIPVPNDPGQTMYVWFEALLNYITVLGYPEHEDFKKFWPANVQVVGKGILRFHAAIWPGILLGLGLPLPKILYVHGYVTINGGKMSKSLGNVVNPKEIIEKYSADVFRYFFLKHVPSYDDGDFTWERLDAAYNGELANELGNAVSRTAAMIQKYQDGVIGDMPAPEHDISDYQEALEVCKFDRALDAVWEQVRGLNQYIDEEKPWSVAKEDDDEHLQQVLAYMCSCLMEIADMLVPFMPETAAKISGIFKEGFLRPIEGTLFPRDDIRVK